MSIRHLLEMVLYRYVLSTLEILVLVPKWTRSHDLVQRCGMEDGTSGSNTSSIRLLLGTSRGEPSEPNERLV